VCAAPGCRRPILWWGDRARCGPWKVVAAATPTDHHRRVVMNGHGDVMESLDVELGHELAAPSGGVGRIDRDHPQPSVRGHLHQAVAELRGGDARDFATQPPAALAARSLGVVAGDGCGEVEVLDGDRRTSGGSGRVDDARDEVADLRVTVGRRAFGGDVEPSVGTSRRTGVPTGLPASSTTRPATWSALRSSANVRPSVSWSRCGVGSGSTVQDASRCQRRLAGS